MLFCGIYCVNKVAQAGGNGKQCPYLPHCFHAGLLVEKMRSPDTAPTPPALYLISSELGKAFTAGSTLNKTCTLEVNI